MFKKIRVLKFSIIDRYILSRFLKFFLVALFFFVAIYFFSNILAELPTILKKVKGNNQITVGAVFKNYFLKIPSFFMTVFPFAFLFTTSYILGSFYKNNEIIAIITSGWSMRRITVGIVLCSFIFSIGLMFLNFSFVPNYNYKSTQSEDKLYSDRNVKEDVNNLQTYGEGGILYFARNYLARRQEINSIKIMKTRNKNKMKISKIKSVVYDELKNLSVEENIKKITESEINSKIVYPYQWIIYGDQLKWNNSKKKWVLKKGKKFYFNEKGEQDKPVEELLNIEVDLKEKPGYFSKETKKVKEMSLNEALNFIAKLKKSQKSYKKHIVQLYNDKYANPFSVFILAILASSLGRFFSRKHLLIMTLLISFLIGAVYYILSNIGISLGNEDVLPPLIAAFLGNLLSIGFYFYIKRKQLT